MKAAPYIRVSTDDQREGASLDVQLERCRAYAEAQGWTVVAEFSDPGVSGAAFYERAGLLAALAAAERDEVEVLVAYNLDRFSRGVWTQLTAAAEEAGLRLVTADGVIDTDDDDRELPADMYEAFAKEQRRMTVKKSMASRAQRVRSGNWVGGVAPFGHRIEKGERGSRLVVNDDERVIIERAFALMLDDHCSPGETADKLNAEGFTKRGRRWTSRNLIQSLERTTLAGRFIYGKERRAKTRYDAARYGIDGHEAEVPAVVSEERFAAMQKLLAGVKWTKQTAHEYPLSARIVTEDGHSFTGRWDTRNQKRRYRCRERYDQSSAGRHGAHCSHKEIAADGIEAAVWWALEDEFRTMDKFYELLDALDDSPADAEAAGQAKAQHSARLSKLRDQRVEVEARGLREGFSLAAIESALAEIDADIATLEAELAAAERWLDNALKAEQQRDVLSSWERWDEVFDRPDLEMVKRVYEALDLRVTLLEGGHAEVTINLPLDRGLDTIVATTTSRRRRRERRSRPPRRLRSAAPGAARLGRASTAAAHRGGAAGARRAVATPRQGPARATPPDDARAAVRATAPPARTSARRHRDAGRARQPRPRGRACAGHRPSSARRAAGRHRRTRRPPARTRTRAAARSTRGSARPATRPAHRSSRTAAVSGAGARRCTHRRAARPAARTRRSAAAAAGRAAHGGRYCCACCANVTASSQNCSSSTNASRHVSVERRSRSNGASRSAGDAEPPAARKSRYFGAKPSGSSR